MRPERKVEQITREYWSCAIPKHRHMTEAIAAKCLAKHPTIPLKRWRWTTEEVLRVATRINVGESMASIGRNYGVTGGTIARVMRDRAWNLPRPEYGTPEWTAWMEWFHNLKTKDYAMLLLDNSRRIVEKRSQVLGFT